ncbi:hypothetical protein GCK32_012236, partial [Trichostrongylus colubriformis]
VHSDVDEVDSDFDKPEEEDEPISGDENEEKHAKRKGVKGYKEPSRGSRAETSRNKAWAMARMAGKVVAANSVDAKTQAARLKEAEQTEKANIESLRKLSFCTETSLFPFILDVLKWRARRESDCLDQAGGW